MNIELAFSIKEHLRDQNRVVFIESARRSSIIISINQNRDSVMLGRCGTQNVRVIILHTRQDPAELSTGYSRVPDSGSYPKLFIRAWQSKVVSFQRRVRSKAREPTRVLNIAIIKCNCGSDKLELPQRGHSGSNR